MKRCLLGVAMATMLLAGCGTGSSTPLTSLAAVQSVTPTPEPTATPTATPTPSPEPTATPNPTPDPTPQPVVPTTYATLSSRSWAQILKAPDNYTGNGYIVWGCITQFDAATGPDRFRAQASYKTQAFWYTDGANVFFAGDAGKLADFVANDIVVMHVVGAGSYSYDTQNGGNTTVPMFHVDTIQRKGSC